MKKNTPSHAERVRHLVLDIRGAIALRESLFQRDLDYKFAASEGIIYYAIDANLLNWYFQDDVNRLVKAEAAIRIFEGPPGSKHSVSETRVFDIILTHLVNSLAPKLGRDHPLILLPGHAGEARGLYDRLIEGVGKNTVKRDNSKRRLTAILQTLDRSRSRQEELLGGYETQLHELLYEVRDGADRLRRFNRLVANGQLRSTATLRHLPHWSKLIEDDPRLAPILEAGAETPDDAIVEGSKDWWNGKLEEMPELYVESDALALFTLDRLNRALVTKNVRIVLLTGNDHLIRAASAYFPFLNTETALSSYSFADLFIRTPKAMLFEPDILLPGNVGTVAAQTEASGWLDAFLAKILSQDCKDVLAFREHRPDISKPEKIEAIASNVLKEWPASHRTLFEDWLKHLDQITRAHVSTSAEARRNIELWMSAADVGRLPRLERLGDAIDRATEESWNEFFLTAAKSGYEMIGLSADKAQGRKRNVPLLFLRDMPQAEQLLDYVQQWHGIVRHENQIRELLGRLDKDITRKGRYAGALCYALLFAYADRWAAAKVLAKRAIDIADPSVPDNVSGREALYLSCVTHRLTARFRNDLLRCDHLLESARAALAKDRAEDLKRTTPSKYAEITGLRFDSEGVAIDTARALFDGFDQSWELQGRNDLVARVRGTIETAQQVLEKECDDPLIKPSSQLNLRTNYFSGLFLLQCAGALKPHDVRHVDHLVGAQVESARKIDGDDTPLSSLSVIDMSVLNYAASLLAWAGRREEIPAILSGSVAEIGGMPEPFLMPYDRSRYEKMATLTQSNQEGVVGVLA